MLQKYNREKAVKYAIDWALKYNPNFYNFTHIGGDCTNYISQCLYYSGIPMNHNSNGWFYNSTFSRSPSWTSVESLQSFLLNNTSTGPVAKTVSLDQIEIGDIIQIRQNLKTFNHSVIVTKKQNNQIFVCAHTFNVLNKNLADYFAIELLPIHIEGFNG